MFAKVPQLKLEDWDIAVVNKFPKFVPELYLDQVIYEGGIVRLEVMRWVLGLHKAGLLNLLHIPHFWCNPVNDICAR